jgi:hypothetical protein
MQIEDYDFGTIKIDGKTYTGDLKIINRRVISGWWRIEGHRLLPPDIEDVFEARPEVLIVGTGDPGLMTVSVEVEAKLAELGIQLVAMPTREASKIFNDMSQKRNTAFVAHLTC